MKSYLLLPHRFKTLGWWILIPSTIAGILLISTGFEAEWLSWKVPTLFYDEISLFRDVVVHKTGPFSWIETNITNTVVGVILLVGALMVAFSKEKVEDEYIANLRLSSLLWSVWVNYLLLLVGFIFIYGLTFLHVMIYNMFTVLIIFIIRFNILIRKNANPAFDEK